MHCDSIGFWENVFDACGPSLLQKLLAIVHRQHQHSRIRSQPGNLTCGFYAVHDRHLQIQYHDVGVQFLYSIDRYFAVLCFPAYLPSTVLLDASAQGMADQGVIVGNEN